MNQLLERREFQGRLLLTCFERTSVKFSQPPFCKFCRRFQPEDTGSNFICRKVTSLSADFSKLNKGSQHFPINVQLGNSGLLFLPAAGNRNNNSSGYNNVGTNGNYWSSSINGTNAYNTNFNSTNVNPGNNNNNRANGFSIRCIAALNQKVFDFRLKTFNN